MILEEIHKIIYGGGSINLTRIIYADNTRADIILIEYDNFEFSFNIVKYLSSDVFNIYFHDHGWAGKTESISHPLYLIVENIILATRAEDNTLLSPEAMKLLDKIYSEIEIRSKIYEDLIDVTFIYPTSMKSAK